MRYTVIKTEAQQATGMGFRTRDLLLRQRTQMINAIRGHPTEFGWVLYSAEPKRSQIALFKYSSITKFPAFSPILQYRIMNGNY